MLPNVSWFRNSLDEKILKKNKSFGEEVQIYEGLRRLQVVKISKLPAIPWNFDSFSHIVSF